MNKKSKSYIVFLIFNYTLLTALTIMFLFPYLNQVAKALNDSADTARGGMLIFPRKFTMHNITTILSDKSIFSGLMISVIRVVTGTLVAIVIQFSAGYAFTKKDLYGRSGFLVFLTVPMFITGGLIPQYILYSRLGLLNNFLVYIIPTAFSFFNMVVIRTYIDSIPASLFESARLDGASEPRILATMVIPLSKPIIATIALWTLVGYWNDWTTTLYFVTSKKLFTLQYMLMQVINESQRVQEMIQDAIQSGRSASNVQVQTTPESLKSAQIVITTLPIICVYPFLQKYFIKGIMVGSVKG